MQLEYSQIFHTGGDHWIMLTTIGCSKDHILVYGLLYDDSATKYSVETVFHGSHAFVLQCACNT